MGRLPSDVEVYAIHKIASKLPPDTGAQLLFDLARATVRQQVFDTSRLVFDIAGYERPIYRGQHSFGVEGELLDKDGKRLSLDLYADENGHLLELELIRWDEGKVIEPNWETLKLF